MKQVSATMFLKAAIASTICSLRYTQCVKVLGPLLPKRVLSRPGTVETPVPSSLPRREGGKIFCASDFEGGSTVYRPLCRLARGRNKKMMLDPLPHCVSWQRPSSSVISALASATFSRPASQRKKRRRVRQCGRVSTRFVQIACPG